jgi:dextranase
VTISCTDSSKKITFNNWPPQQRTVTTFAKEIDGKTVLHLLNFINIDDLSWRDLNCTRSIPQLKLSFPVAITTNKSVKKVWLASPDQHGGVAQELAFTLSNGTLSFTVPRLKYWDMIVIE